MILPISAYKYQWCWWCYHRCTVCYIESLGILKILKWYFHCQWIMIMLLALVILPDTNYTNCPSKITWTLISLIIYNIWCNDYEILHCHSLTWHKLNYISGMVLSALTRQISHIVLCGAKLLMSDFGKQLIALWRI